VKTIYVVNLDGFNQIQNDVMKFVDWWVRNKKVQVPRSEIIKKMQSTGTDMPTTRYAIRSLLKKGYIRTSNTISNKTYYVQLRTI